MLSLWNGERFDKQGDSFKIENRKFSKCLLIFDLIKRKSIDKSNERMASDKLFTMLGSFLFILSFFLGMRDFGKKIELCLSSKSEIYWVENVSFSIPTKLLTSFFFFAMLFSYSLQAIFLQVSFRNECYANKF